MKILIAGAGKVGTTLTRQLSSAGYDVILIDLRQQVLEDTVEKYDVMGLTGNCIVMETLIEAGVKEADLLIASTNADEINLLCCTTAHYLNPSLHTIARIRNPEYHEQVFQMRDVFALSMVVNPEMQAATEIEHLLKYPGFLKRDSFAKGKVEIVELRIDRLSRLCDVALNDMYQIVKCRVLVCAVLREGSVVAPDGNFVLRDGDRIFVTAPTENLTILLNNLGIITKKVRRVMICGGGRVSYYLAEQLEKDGIDVQIVEKDAERCEQLAEQLNRTTVVHGDISNYFLLESEGLKEYDALVTATGMDELNIVTSLYAASCGVPQVITKLGHTENTDLLEKLSVGSVICPKDLCSNSIARYIRAMHNQTGAAISVHAIADGKAEAMEFCVDDQTKFCGIPLRNLKLKKNILLACITKRGVTEIPGGNSYYMVGDTVVIVSTRDDVIYSLNDIFE